MKFILLFLFVVHLVLLAYFNNLYLGGVPLRSPLLALLGVLTLLSGGMEPDKFKLINVVYALLAVLGVIVSLANNVGWGDIFSGELKLFQSYLMIFTSYCLINQFGFRVLIYVFLLVALPSAVVGIMQFLNVNFAWSLHELLGLLQNKDLGDEKAQLEAVMDRPPGLTLYAIPQTYLLLSAMILTSYLGLTSRGNLTRILVASGISILLMGGIFATETRSALGAALLIFAVVSVRQFPRESLLLAALAVLGFLIAHFSGLGVSGEAVDSRMLSLDDPSAIGRMTLYKYGLELFLRNPFGYGYGFDTVAYAVEYFINEHNLFAYDVNEKAQYLVPVHNSILNLVHTYGFAGVVILFWYVRQLTVGSWYRLAFIGAAFVNSAFHNAGILSDDLYMDVVIALFVYEINRARDRQSVVLTKGNSMSAEVFRRKIIHSDGV